MLLYLYRDSGIFVVLLWYRGLLRYPQNVGTFLETRTVTFNMFVNVFWVGAKKSQISKNCIPVFLIDKWLKR